MKIRGGGGGREEEKVSWALKKMYDKIRLENMKICVE